MLSRDQAKQLVQSRLDIETGESGCSMVVIDSSTLERPFGWVFFYQSEDYLLTGNESSQLAGNAPLIVNRHTGLITVAGTAAPVEDYIARYELSLAQGAA
jgi:hypothetical protein